jgi:predicted nucleotidyltransferase
MGEGERTERDDPATFFGVLGLTVRTLEDAGVPHVLVGSVAANVYGMPDEAGDLDLLIRPVDERRALDALRAAGFDTDETDQTWVSKAFRDGVMVDLITQLTGDLFLDDDMLASARRIDVHGTDVNVASPEDVVLIEAATNSPEIQAHWYKAISIVMRTPLDWGYLLERARLAPRRILALLIYAQSDDIEIPDDAVRALLDRIYATA